MDVLLSLKVFSLDFYFFLILFYFIFIEIRGYPDSNPLGEWGSRTCDGDRNGDEGQNPKRGQGAGGMSPPPWVPIAIPIQQHNGKISHRLESQIIYIFRNYQVSDLKKKKNQRLQI